MDQTSIQIRMLGRSGGLYARAERVIGNTPLPVRSNERIEPYIVRKGD